MTRGQTRQDRGERELKREEKGVTRRRKGRKGGERREQSGKGGEWRRRGVPPPTIIKEREWAALSGYHKSERSKEDRLPPPPGGGPL